MLPMHASHQGLSIRIGRPIPTNLCFVGVLTSYLSCPHRDLHPVLRLHLRARDGLCPTRRWQLANTVGSGTADMHIQPSSPPLTRVGQGMRTRRVRVRTLPSPSPATLEHEGATDKWAD